MERLLTGIYKLNINIFKLEKINYKELILEIYEKDLEKIKKLSILNTIKVMDYKGKLKLKNKWALNKAFVFSCIMGLFVLTVLSNFIFKIEVVHTSNKVRNHILEELKEHGIKIYQLRKSFKNLEKVKNDILEDNKNSLEWLEIERIGTKYVVRLEERLIKREETKREPSNIVATKDAVIKKIIVSSGVASVEVGDYVKKGDLLINGEILLNEEVKGVTTAKGEVYGEVWYNISIDYPINSVLTYETKKKKNMLTLNFFSRRITLKKKYENSNVVKKYVFKNNILPFGISKDIEYELKLLDGIYSEGEALLNAKKYAKDKLESTLKEEEYIIKEKVLNYRVNNNTIYMNIFYKVYCNITGYETILIEE